LAVSWTDSEEFNGKEGEEVVVEGEMWVTAIPDMRDFCQAYEPTAEAPYELRISQLVGVPPNVGWNRYVEVWVDPATVFRPAPDPEITDSTAGLEMVQPEDFDDETFAAFQEWFNAYNSVAYNLENGFPWIPPSRLKKSIWTGHIVKINLVQ